MLSCNLAPVHETHSVFLPPPSLTSCFFSLALRTRHTSVFFLAPLCLFVCFRYMEWEGVQIPTKISPSFSCSPFGVKFFFPPLCLVVLHLFFLQIPLVPPPSRCPFSACLYFLPILSPDLSHRQFLLLPSCRFVSAFFFLN